MKLDQKMFAKLRAATAHLMAKGPAAATASIQEALQGRSPGNGTAAPGQPRPMQDINPVPGHKQDKTSNMASDKSGDTATAGPKADSGNGFVNDLLSKLGLSDIGNLKFDPAAFVPPSLNPHPAGQANVDRHTDSGANGKFTDGSFSNQAGSRAYKLYVPTAYHGQALPLVVMLHGCTQNPDDFAIGTGMNAVAEEMKCLVLYPAQAQSANASKCWNWFNAADQQHGQGEPAIIAGMTHQIIATYHVNPQQVYIAGLSAGGAMAVIMGKLYPDLYAAVGVHSGLPYGAAHDMPSAFAAMKGGTAGRPERQARAASVTPQNPVPVIVFHGDRDTTVHPHNGMQVMAQHGADGTATAAPKILRGSIPNGHSYTRTTHHNQGGHGIAEHWAIHGAGHAWSGGSQHGSYTDAKGPDASREMLRFFYSHRRSH
jgi:poly(hydroxyalkanoate) depolymerase family esterase